MHVDSAMAARSRRQAVTADNADTFPRLLQRHARVRPYSAAIREKDLGIWQSWSWMQMLQEVREVAGGLLQAGFKRGEHLAIIGENRPHLYFTMTAVQCLGGIPVPMYQDAVAAEMAFVFDNAEIGFAMVEDQEQVDKVLEIREKVPHLRRIIYDDPRGLRNYNQPGLASYEQLRVLGQQFLREHRARSTRDRPRARDRHRGDVLHVGRRGSPRASCSATTT
jgi:long-chain acyl-CoA synthetase